MEFAIIPSELLQSLEVDHIIVNFIIPNKLLTSILSNQEITSQ